MGNTAKQYELLPVPARLEVVIGNNKGAFYDILQGEFSIGRSDENDVVIPSEAISRRHAVIEKIDADHFNIRDLKSRNGVQVNGKQVQNESVALKTGDIIQIGNVVLRFHPPAFQKNSVINFEAAPAAATKPPSKSLLAKFQKLDAQQKRRILIYGGVGAVLLWVLLSGNSETPTNTETKKGDFKYSQLPASGQSSSAVGSENISTQDPNVTTPSLNSQGQPKGPKGLEDPLLKQSETDLEKLDWTNSPLKGAEYYFRKGQREYLNKNYHRAIEDFQTALSMYRGHELAQTYLRYAIYEVENEARKQMEIGIQYFESLQYARALYHFNEVVSLMVHRASDPMVTQAEKYGDLCKKKLEAKELFP